MKHPVIFISFSFLLIGFTAKSLKTSPLVGKWRGEDGKEVGFIAFDKKGYVSFSLRDQEIGGKKYLSEGIVYDMTYETDDSTEPFKMDFVVRTNADQLEIARMPGIYKLVDSKTLVINMKFDGSERPNAFDDDSDDQIGLKKTK